MSRTENPNVDVGLPATDVQLSIVLPVYNEVENIPILFEELRHTLRNDIQDSHSPYEVIWVEDGSDDGTARSIDELAAEHSFVTAIHLRRNWGQSAALASGFDTAAGNVVVPMDADLQNDPADIPVLLEKLDEGYDCVSGYRKERDDPLSKRIPSRIQTTLAKWTGPDINDFGCTLKAYRNDALEDIDLYGEGHRYIPAKLYDKGYSITEVEVNHRPRERGESRYGVGRLVRGFSDLVFHYLWNEYSTRPFHLFGGLGFLILSFGVLIGGVLVGQRFLLGVSLMQHLPALLLSVAMVLFGLVVLMFGTVIEFLTKLYYRDEQEYRIDRVVK
jgi:glycosyltransferase involved in cell wall biosynthesis